MFEMAERHKVQAQICAQIPRQSSQSSRGGWRVLVQLCDARASCRFAPSFLFKAAFMPAAISKVAMNFGCFWPSGLWRVWPGLQLLWTSARETRVQVKALQVTVLHLCQRLYEKMTLFLSIFSVAFIPDKTGTEESAVCDHGIHKPDNRRQNLHLLWVVFFSVCCYFHKMAFGIRSTGKLRLDDAS